MDCTMEGDGILSCPKVIRVTSGASRAVHRKGASCEDVCQQPVGVRRLSVLPGSSYGCPPARIGGGLMFTAESVEILVLVENWVDMLLEDQHQDDGGLHCVTRNGLIAHFDP